MKVLWLTNLKIPRIDEIEGNQDRAVVGGWLSGLSDTILSRTDVDELTILYPSFDQKKHEGTAERFAYIGIPVCSSEFGRGTLDTEKYKDILKDILIRVKPDVIHVHGTEFQLSYAMALACRDVGLLDRTVVSIQGLVSRIATHYFAGLPHKITGRRTILEWVDHSSLRDTRDKYASRGVFEEKTLRLIPNIIGRTRWDKGCTRMIAPGSRYYFCNETLRREFYSGSWEYDKCEKYSVFLSQGANPIKGVHMVLKAIHLLKERYPRISVKIGGANLFDRSNLRWNTYARYLHRLVAEYGLQEHVQFTGFLQASQMKEQMLAANVFVSPSSIENSPNSLAEAMLLGVPCIASNVGGVSDLLEDGEEGCLYPYDEYYMLAHDLSFIFDNPEKAEIMGKNAQKHARVTHDPELNYQQLIKTYRELAQ